jgi:heme exporter protein CcmD
MMEIFEMGKYGSFVWSSYLLTLLVVIFNAVHVKYRHRQIENEIKRRLKIEKFSE